VLVPVVVIFFLLGQPWLSIGIALLAALAAYETARLVRLAGLSSDPWLAAALAVLAVLAMWWLVSHQSVSRSALAGICFVGLVVISTAVVSLRKEPSEGFKTWVGTMVATFYPSLLAFMAGIALVVGPLPASSFFVGRLDAGKAWLVVLVLTVWSLDSFAYLSGKLIGRGRFMNHISPNKTWSGAIGGGIAAVVVCAVLTVAVGEQLLWGLVLGGFIAIAAQAGDLTESMLKRAAGEKDSGTLIPGHGGLLDRLDSFLFAAPVMFTVLLWLGYFQPYFTIQLL